MLSAPAAAGRSELSTVTFKFIKKRWAISSAISSFIETKRLNKFQSSSTFRWARIAIFIFGIYLRHLESRSSSNFPLELVSIWKAHKSDEAVDCKEADPQPRSISPVLKGTWKGSFKLCYHNWNLWLKVRIFDIWISPPASYIPQNRNFRILPTPPFVVDVDDFYGTISITLDLLIGKHRLNYIINYTQRAISPTYEI